MDYSEEAYLRKLQQEDIEIERKMDAFEKSEAQKRKENPFHDWKEHDDIDPNTGEYYSLAHQLRIVGKSNRI